CNRCRLPPAQKWLPSPVMTTLRTSVLFSAAISASTPAAYSSGPSALRCSGLLMVSTRVAPWLWLLRLAVMRGFRGRRVGSCLFVRETQAQGAAAAQPGRGAVARVAVHGL